MSYMKDAMRNTLCEEELKKENRALDMELMEAYEKIRSLENTLAFLKLTKFGTKNEKL